MTHPLGWIDFPQRTREMNLLHDAALAAMPERFHLAGPPKAEVDKLCLFDVWTDAEVVAAIGRPFLGVHQITGSCVGAGYGNVLFTLAALEVLRLHDPEQIIVPFWLFAYGISRMLIGERSRGEGSLGSAIAEAARLYGNLQQGEAGLPTYTADDGFVWGKSTELAWSNGNEFDPKWLAMGKKNLVRTTAPQKTASGVWTAIQNLYPTTIASPYYVQPGTEKIVGSGDNRVCIGGFTGRGGHQTSILAVWNHPTEGRLYWNENQWGLNVYQKDPTTGRASGCWMRESSIESVCKSGDGEVYSYSQFDGFLAQMRSWGKLLPE